MGASIGKSFLIRTVKIMDVHYIILEAQKPGQLKYLTNKTLVGLNSRMQSLPSAVIKKEEVNPHA